MHMLSFAALEIVVLMLVVANATALRINRANKCAVDEQNKKVDGIDMGCQTSIANNRITGVDKGTMTEEDLMDDVLPNSSMDADRRMKCSNGLERGAGLSLGRTTCDRSFSVQQSHQHDLKHNQGMVAHHNDLDRDEKSDVFEHEVCTAYDANERGDEVVHGANDHSTSRASNAIRLKAKVEMCLERVKNMILNCFSCYMQWKEADDIETENFIDELIPDAAGFEDAVDQELEEPQEGLGESFVRLFHDYTTASSNDEDGEFMLDENNEGDVYDMDE
ncbi:hypothetical protein VCUG_00637 [Vavraia culicis subsp. floridensis]|uniref:Uncharacterized protein n=1 Tax=Vavraia culicis (isolate floridensis) TaxID=948595 RepID=L2GX54_VAVCU|nr:uncharacterized protein VCUG_00637 [Vavraia culicis subsp. floridensis]ELA47917.1 hypothetical protein VCUG_00637 [Vavraia culicis subsp. floridensis]